MTYQRFHVSARGFCQWLLGAVLGVVLVACGGGGGDGSSSAAPGISSQPSSQSILAGATAVFSVSATGTAPLSYQWRKNGTEIAGANSASYTTPAMTMSDNGARFSVVVANSVGSVTSSDATLTVTAAAPSIVTQPSAQTALVGQTATYSVSVTGTAPLSYQWRKNGSNITGATGASYTTPTLTLADSGATYSVVVSNSLGSVTSNSAALTVFASSVGHLVISEVSSCYYYDVGCWFEIFNPTGSTVNLSGYQLKSTAVNLTTGYSVGSQTFSLPSFSVAAGGHVVIAGNTMGLTQRGTQVVPLKSGNMVPFWTSSGFIELLNVAGTVTVDFVRFGSSSQNPVTASEWSGTSVSALTSASATYGKSIVRAYPAIGTTDTHTASDWSARDWTTPGGRNDVPAGAADADSDGIPDSAETSGGTYGGLDLYAMGARTGQRDIFIEVDYMNSADPGVIPRSESLQKVVDSFAAQNIKVHFDAGTQFSAGYSPTGFNLGQGSNLVPYEPCVTLDASTCTANASRRSIWDWKYEYADIRRAGVFHYALFGNSQLANGGGGSSGLAELPGNDLLVTMGNWGFSTSAGAPLNKLINMQASTLMHELGHNLSLGHGGNEHVNYKPNYWSIMNYLYQLDGLDANPAGNTAYLRWRKVVYGDVDSCSLPNSPCGDRSAFIMSYSNGTSSVLNESSLYEANNVGRGNSGGTAFADWNGNGIQDGTPYAMNLNVRDPYYGNVTVLSDHNDWGNLLLAFSRYYGGNSGRTLTTMPDSRVFNPVTDDRQPVSPPCAPPSFTQIRNSHVH